MVCVASILARNPELGSHVGYLDRAFAADASGRTDAQFKSVSYVIFDGESLDWGRTASTWVTPPACREPVAVLAPDNRDTGCWLLRAALHLTEDHRTAARQRLNPLLHRCLEPRATTVYRVVADNLRCDRASIQPASLLTRSHKIHSDRHQALYLPVIHRVNPIFTRC